MRLYFKYYIFFLFLCSQNFFGLVKVDNLFYRLLCVLGVLFYICAPSNKRVGRNFYFKNECLIFMFIPLMSSISSNINYGQTFVQSFTIWFPCLIWLLYFCLHRYQIKTEAIIKLFLYCALLILFLQILGQFSLDFYLGKGMDEFGELEERNGLTRLRLGTKIQMILLMYFWMRYLLYKKNNDLLFALLMLTSVYMSLTRQTIATAMLIMILALFFVDKGQKKSHVWVTITILTAVIFYFREELFGFFIEKTDQELKEGNNIRDYSMLFYWQGYTQDLLRILLGNGTPHQASQLGAYHIKIMSNGFYADDVGIVGQLWYYGIFYVLAFFSIIYKVLIKYRKYIAPWLTLYTLSVTFTLFYMFPLAHSPGWMIWVLLLYLIDCSINEHVNYERSVCYNR